MRSLAIYLLYIATALRGALQVAEMRDPTLTIILLAVFGLLLFSEPWLSRRLTSHSAPAAGAYHVGYLLLQMGLILVMVLPEPTPDSFLGLFFPLAYQAIQLFGWQTGRWWILSFMAPMLAYAIRHSDPNNLIMAPIYESACLLLGGLAHLFDKAETARAENLRMAQELQAAQKELERYASQVEELAAERARTQLARELHDSVTQTVFSMNLAVEAARLILPHGPAPTAAQLDKVQSLARNALQEIRELISQLQSVGTDSQDLASGIKLLASRYRAGGELDVDVRITSDHRELPADLAARLCKIVQEALANVKKHAGTSKVFVRIDLAARPAWVEVEDCGRGFDLQAAMGRSGHLGLAEMAERAREIGWRLTIDSEPGRGTRVRIEEHMESAG